MTKKIREINTLDLSDERYRFLVEQSGDLISTHRPGDWAYTAVNPAVKVVCGYQPEEIMGKPAYDYFHPDDAEAMKNKLIPAIYRHGIRTFRYRHRHKNGKYYWVESTHRSIRDDNSGELQEIIAVTRDINAQVEAQEMSQRLAKVVEASSDLLVFCNQSYQITYMNPSALRFFDVAKQSTPIDLSHLFSAQSVQKLTALAADIAQSSDNWRGNLPIKSSQFSERFIVLQELLIHSQQSTNETGDHYVFIFKDISAQKRAEQEKHQHQAEIAHASRLMTMGEMASGLAHEINQPLATTLNYARGALRHLEHGTLDDIEKVRSVFDNIVRQTQRAADIVKRLRTLVKKTPYQRSKVSLNVLCRDVVFFLQHELQDSQTTVQLDLASDIPEIDADNVQIEQVLINLLRNAIDAYSNISAEEKCVHIQTRYDAQTVSLLVTDHGRGIADSLIQCLFDPYVSDKPTGLGMGLSISRTIIEAHGGEISVKSDKSTFTTFQVILPRPIS
ncbi:PAS domain-containing sensor histidine kinase [Neptunicella sp.]|uniref:PAS domain-containing sensor histidine kinase n=1 Tax=Neptunicella sp. TaxID=2125986 RepID=UPI003F69231F